MRCCSTDRCLQPRTAYGLPAGRRRHLTSPSAEHDRAYWRKSLDDLVADGRGEAFEDYATDRRRPEVPSGRSAPLLIERLEAATVASLTRIAQAHRTGLHGLLLTLLAAEIRRRSGRGRRRDRRHRGVRPSDGCRDGRGALRQSAALGVARRKRRAGAGDCEASRHPGPLPKRWPTPDTPPVWCFGSSASATRTRARCRAPRCSTSR